MEKPNRNVSISFLWLQLLCVWEWVFSSNIIIVFIPLSCSMIQWIGRVITYKEGELSFNLPFIHSTSNDMSFCLSHLNSPFNYSQRPSLISSNFLYIEPFVAYLNIIRSVLLSKTILRVHNKLLIFFSFSMVYDKNSLFPRDRISDLCFGISVTWQIRTLNILFKVSWASGSYLLLKLLYHTHSCSISLSLSLSLSSLSAAAYSLYF